MRHAFVLASMLAVGASASVGACGSSNSTPTGPGSSGGATSSSSSSTTAAGSSSTTAASSSGGAATCAAGAGTVHNEPWDFAASAPSLNGGKGQVITIHVCDSVQWMNDESDGTEHSVIGTSPNATFIMTSALAGTAPPGTALPPPIQFTTAGTFTYDCGIHGMAMIGQVTVQ